MTNKTPFLPWLSPPRKTTENAYVAISIKINHFNALNAKKKHIIVPKYKTIDLKFPNSSA